MTKAIGKDPDKCFVNYALGGGVFVCRRPPKPGGNGFCAFHGEKKANDPDLGLELTWREWLRVWFIRRPRNILRWIRERPRKIRFWWWTRKNAPCAFCSNKSMLEENGRRVCFDHYGP